MQKFIITGSMRSGTTFLASLLNSQNDTFCLEDSPWKRFPKVFSNAEHFNCVVNRIDSDFNYLGLREPKLSAKAMDGDSLVDLYIQHLKSLYASKNVGFKITMMTRKEIQSRVDEGYKIIIMKRDSESILRSWVNRLSPDLEKASHMLQEFLIGINYYNPDLPEETYRVINFSDMIANLEQTLEELSEFLGIELQLVNEKYHSFNKGRATFSGNSSFVEAAGSSMSLNYPAKYSDVDFRNCSELVDNRKFKIGFKARIIQYLAKTYKDKIS
jgi:hypothetical protein